MQTKQSPLLVMAARHQIEPERLLKTLKNTVIKPTKNHTPTDEEILAFVMVANQYGLNPFTKQVHAFASQGGIVPMVGIDGWAELVNRREEFDGCDFDERQSEDGTPLCTTCIMHAKARQHPVRVTEWFAECKRPTIPWQTMPRRMLRHKAFIQAARICFGLSGIYDEDEARDILRNAKEVIDHAPPVGRGSLRELPTPTQPEVAEEPEPEPEPSREPGDDTAFEKIRSVEGRKK